MYTQCVKCETVFRLAAETLRVAGGQVRCGRCGEVFNALARLAEDPSTFPPVESPLDMEVRADEILHSAMPPLGQIGKPPEADGDTIELEDYDPLGTEFARLQLVEKFVEDLAPATAAPDPPRSAPAPTQTAAAPKSVPPAPSAPPRSAPTRATPPPPKPADSDATEDGSSLEFTLPPGELDRVFVERATRLPQGILPVPDSQPAPPEQQSEHLVSEQSLLKVGTDLEISEDVRRAMLSGISRPAARAPLSLPDLEPAPSRSLPFSLWLVAAVILALLLGAQWLHANRGWLATHGPWRGTAPPPSLTAYQLRQWGVTGDANANGTLRVRASILNTTAQLQPYPLLRVTLANRFGAKIGARDFEPAEYMGKPIARMLAPSERADATLDIVDPGKDAEGFEIDVCLRGADQKISCAGDAAAQAKP